MRSIPYPSWFLASSLVLVASSCSKSDESTPEAEPALVAAAEDEPLSGHVFLRLTGATPGLLADRFPEERLDLALDRIENYYLSVGSWVLVVDRGAPKPYLRTIELPTPLTLLGIRDDDLILFGNDPARCPPDEKAGKLYAMPADNCTSVFRRASDGEGQVVLVGAFDGRNPVLAGDHVAALTKGTLVHMSLADGQVRQTSLDAEPDGKLAVDGERLLWDAMVPEGGGLRSIVMQSRAPFDKTEVVFQHDGMADSGVIFDVAWIGGESIAYLVSEPRGGMELEVKLYRRTGEQTELLLAELPITTRLTHDGGAAWLIDWKPGAERLWKIGPKAHRRITTTTAPKLVTGTRSGLAWVEERDGVLSFHLTGMGPANMGELESDATVLELGSTGQAGFGNNAKAEPTPSPTPTVDGDLAADLVKRIIRAHVKETRACYDDAKNPELAGTLTVAFVIGKTGKVSKTEIVGESLDPALGKCVTKALSRWTFPKPGDGEPVDVSYPFVFPPA